MKMKLKAGFSCVLVIAGIGASDLMGWQAFAADTNPYGEGTTAVRLSTEEKNELLQYADNSKARLDKAMEQAKGKGFAEANSIYLSAIKSVVLYSYVQKPRSELLMRYTLNQALALTFGVPSADGRTIQTPGVLARVSNFDLLTMILEDSIRLALSFYQDDRTAIQNGTLVNLPFMNQAAGELALARKWLTSVNEPTLKYNLSMAALQNFLNTAANENQTRRALFAEELTEVSDLLDSLPAQAPKDVGSLMSNVRMLRGKLKKLQNSVTQKGLLSDADLNMGRDSVADESSENVSDGGALASIGSKNFDACYEFYLPNMSSSNAANACLAPARVQFNFQNPNFKKCYEIYFRSMSSYNAADACMSAQRVKLDFSSPNFLKCYGIYFNSMRSSDAADACISKSAGK
jgi:hypothetical protein